MAIDLQKIKSIREDGDVKQKDYLRKLGYSENVINALFPERDESEIFLDNGSNLILGFKVALGENKA